MIALLMIKKMKNNESEVKNEQCEVKNEQCEVDGRCFLRFSC